MAAEHEFCEVLDVVEAFVVPTTAGLETCGVFAYDLLGLRGVV